MLKGLLHSYTFLSLCYYSISGLAQPTDISGDTNRIPHSPHTISLQSRSSIREPVVISRDAGFSQVNVPLNDFFLVTDLQWFGDITVGTPPQTLTVIFDTQFTALMFASTRCSTCTQTKFNSSKSSTFVSGGGQVTVNFFSSFGVDTLSTSNDYKLVGQTCKDTVSIAGFSAPNVPVNLVSSQSPKFNNFPFSGIQGMAPGSQGIFASLVNQGFPSLFGIYYTPASVGNAELTLGGVDSTKFTGNPIFASLTPAPAPGFTSWQLTSPGIFVNGKTTSILNVPRNISINSATSNILLDVTTANAIYALISPDIKPNPNQAGTYGFPCNLINSLPAVINIAFTSQVGTKFNLTIPSSELNVGPFTSDTTLCQTLINTNTVSGSIVAVGGSLLKHYYSIWDIANNRMGFAPALGV